MLPIFVLSERPAADGALGKALDVFVASKGVNLVLLLSCVFVDIDHVWNYDLSAHGARIVLLHDPAIEADRVENVLRVTFQRSNY